MLVGVKPIPPVTAVYPYEQTAVWHKSMAFMCFIQSLFWFLGYNWFGQWFVVISL